MIQGWLRRCFWLGAMALLAAAPSPWAKTVVNPPTVDAQAAILINADTGTILYEKNAFRQMDPASLTKIMTAILVIKAGHLDREVPVSSRAAYVEGSKLHVHPGQRYSVLDLLRGLLLRSGNDAAIALAEADAGSVEGFVAKMNAQAQALGAFNTRFQNPNGLTGSGHYTDAYDLSLIARTAMTLPQFRAIVASREQEITERKSGAKRTIRTTNRLLYEVPGADGVKTGTTQAAGKCVIASASRDGTRLIAVVLKSQNRWQDANLLLAYGFSAWTTRTVYRLGQTVADASVIGGRDDWVPLVTMASARVSLPKGDEVTVVEQVPRRLKAPVRKKPVGYVYVIADDQQPIRIPVEPQQSVPLNRIPRFWRN
ncbi:MAG: D-alanyl-D-alanine carboxypeptidase [Firmicutes bacterium]|nr:D-alanyl-D-alanine carboxypeptidase [Bacillota bacterium]